MDGWMEIDKKMVLVLMKKIKLNNIKVHFIIIIILNLVLTEGLMELNVNIRIF